MENMRTTKHALCESTRGKQKLQVQTQVSGDDGGLAVEVLFHQFSQMGFHLSARPQCNALQWGTWAVKGGRDKKVKVICLQTTYLQGILRFPDVHSLGQNQVLRQ